MGPDQAEDLAVVFQRTAPRGHDLGCLPPERIWEAVFGELPFAELRAITDHTIRCGDCGDALRLARDLRAASAPEKREPARRSFPAPGGWSALLWPLAWPAWRWLASTS